MFCSASYPLGDTVVYGNSIDVYSCVEALMGMGVCGSRIHLVHPPTDSPGSCFDDPTVAEAVMRALGKSGIHIHHNCLLAQWNDGQHPDPITSVSFTTDGPPLRLKCAVSFFIRTGSLIESVVELLTVKPTVYFMEF